MRLFFLIVINACMVVNVLAQAESSNIDSEWTSEIQMIAGVSKSVNERSEVSEADVKTAMAGLSSDEPIQKELLLFGQPGNPNPRTQKPFGLHLGLTYFLTAESAFYLLNGDYFINPQIDLQANVGSGVEGGLWYAIGSRYHFSKDYSESKFTPFAGLLAGASYEEYFLQVPVGVNYVGESGFNAALSVNELVFLDGFWQSTFVELTLGWRFKSPF